MKLDYISDTRFRRSGWAMTTAMAQQAQEPARWVNAKSRNKNRRAISHYKIAGMRARHTHPSDYKSGNKKKRRSTWRLGADVGTVEIRGSVAELGDASSWCASASGSTVGDVGGVVEGVADSLWTGRRVAELGVRIDADVLVLLSDDAGLGSAGLGEDETHGAGGGLVAGFGAPRPWRCVGSSGSSAAALGSGAGKVWQCFHWRCRQLRRGGEMMRVTRAAAAVVMGDEDEE